MSKVPANSLKIGDTIIINEQLWKIAKNPEHVKPGKGPAYIQLEMKNKKTGEKKNSRFSSSDSLEVANLEIISVQYLYSEDEKMIFMDTSNYEQIEATVEAIGDSRALLEEGMELKAETFKDNIINLILPHSLKVCIQETEPYIRSSTVTSSYKKAILTNGLQIMVPPYIEAGENVIIRSEDLSFVERAKS